MVNCEREMLPSQYLLVIIFPIRKKKNENGIAKQTYVYLLLYRYDSLYVLNAGSRLGICI